MFWVGLIMVITGIFFFMQIILKETGLRFALVWWVPNKEVKIFSSAQEKNHVDVKA